MSDTELIALVAAVVVLVLFMAGVVAFVRWLVAPRPVEDLGRLHNWRPERIDDLYPVSTADSEWERGRP